jgi:hypothetical protein
LKIITSLNDLIKDSKKEEQRLQFALTQAAIRAFEELKEKFITASLLIHFNSDQRIYIKSDTFSAAVILILNQLQDNEL